jgi:hypothetical protein
MILVNDVVACLSAIVVAGLVSLPSTTALAGCLWCLFGYDAAMTLWLGENSGFRRLAGSPVHADISTKPNQAACASAMCGVIDIMDAYRLPMALWLPGGAMVGVGDMICGCIVAAHCTRERGIAAAVPVALAFGIGLIAALEWAGRRGAPVPALVTVVPCLSVVLASIAAWKHCGSGAGGEQSEPRKDAYLACLGARDAGEHTTLLGFNAVSKKDAMFPTELTEERR